MRVEHEKALRQYATDRELEQLKNAVQKDSYKQALKAGRPLPEIDLSTVAPPVAKRLITNDATFESLHEILSMNPAGVFVFRDELTGWLADWSGRGEKGKERSSSRPGAEMVALRLTESDVDRCMLISAA